MGPSEPYWQTNTSFSPRPSRWDFRFQSEGLPYSLNDGTRLYASSTSSNGKDNGHWVRGNHLYDLHYSASERTGLILSSSPSDLSQSPQWTPPAIQEISIDDYTSRTRRDLHPSMRRVSYTPTMEGTSENPDSEGSTSSRSESSEPEDTTKSRLSSQKNFSNRRSFISNPIHPVSFPDLTPPKEAFDPAVTPLSEFGASTLLRDAQGWSSASNSQDFADVTKSFESETPDHPHITSDGFQCSLCERFLSQRSPWSSRRIMRSGVMPTTGVLPCCHVFHAECLEQMTPKTWKNDPPCPVCVRREEENSPDQRSLLRSRNSFPRLKSFTEDGSSRPWGCTRASDCIEGALHAPPQNATFLVNRSRIKRTFILHSSLSSCRPRHE
ncbi:PREDICTED: uncharacterized protein LOC109336209 isoform X1 [Lupinus angustifolius]|uniref:uncharacterized protein LOC109336209 isoform X1 n=1 Tax=Lupinus angustifolius TaxID=3871 RepID=UPI00092F8B93|nr:PREDICTED: uncharacterized protein LOC109336209 isoform X1 [Lupinus angustifolius]